MTAALSLLAYFANGISTPRVRRGFFRKPFLHWVDYLICCQMSYDTGVAIGYGFRDDILEVAKLFCNAGQESELIGELRGTGEALLSEMASPPKSLYDLCFKPELENTVIMDKKMKPFSQTLAMQFASPRLQFRMTEGIGLGFHFPDLADKLWHESHIKWNPEEAERWRRAGLDLPLDSPAPVSLEQKKAEIVPIMRDYVTQFRPDLQEELYSVLR
jgi:hypothetical protein